MGTIGTNGCTWRATPVKTISLACLYNDRGVSGMVCTSPSQFSRAVKALDAAFATSNPLKGGCPDSAPDAFMDSKDANGPNSAISYTVQTPAMSPVPTPVPEAPTTTLTSPPLTSTPLI